MAALAGITAVLLAWGVWLWPNGSGPELRPGVNCTWRAILDSKSARWPACRRPYSDSPFNQRLGPQAQPARSSAANSAWLQRFDVSSLVVGDPARDGGIPFYTSRPHDPLYTLHCYKPWGRCEVEGEKVRIPAAAKPAGVWPNPPFPTDGHLTVVDPKSRWEYDLWAVRSKPRRGGRLNFAWGGRTRIDGNGLDSAAVAARFGSLAGPVRARELVSGRINHALTITVPCARGRVYPAGGRSISCADAGLPGAGAPPMGARYQLALSDDEIAALPVPEWQKTILRALAHYGAFVSDTTSQDHWGIEHESAAAFNSFGEPDPRIALAQSLGSTPQDFNANGHLEYWMYFSPEIDWSRLRVIAPCVSRGTCD